MAEDNDNCWAYRSVCRCRIICRVCALCILCSDCRVLRIRRMFDCRRSTLLNRNHSGFARERTGDQTSDSVWICVRHVVLVSDYRPSQLNSPKLASLRGWTERQLAQKIHKKEDAEALFCYKHVVQSVFAERRKASACPTITQHSVCCFPRYSPSPW